MAKVVARHNSDGTLEDLDSLLRRFRREVNDAGILNAVKMHEFYRSPSEKRKEKKKQREQAIRKAKTGKRF